jgi:hypothetical protein
MSSFGLKKLSGMSAGGLIDYMRDADVTLDYYADEREGRVFDETWGKLGESFGLERGLTREQFTRLFLGQHPDTGEQLAHTNGYLKVERADGSTVIVPKRTAVLDTRLAVRKSVSELLVRAKDNPELQAAIIDVVRQAAKAGFEVMQRQGWAARVPIKTPTQVGARETKMQGSATQRVNAELMAVPVIGLVARPNEETVARCAPGDPHLHVHMPIFTLCKVGDRYYTADSRGFLNKKVTKYVESVFDGEVARGLESLGIKLEYREWDRARNGELSWDVADSNGELCRHWSSNSRRKWQIRQDFETAKNRPMTNTEAERAMASSRLQKSPTDKEQDSLRSVVWDRWWSDAKAHGLEPVAPSLGSAIERDPFVAMGILHQRLMSANGLCRENATFAGSEIRPAVARCAVGLGFSPKELDGYTAILTASDNLQGLVKVRGANDPDFTYWTTPAVIAAELRIKQAASDKSRVVVAPLDDLTIARSIKSADVKLDREQIEGVREVCSGKGWVNITGLAGTGKSSLLKAAVAAYRAADQNEERKRAAQEAAVAVRRTSPNDRRPQHPALRTEIVVVSMVAKTAADTGRKIGADRWGSVESILKQVESGKFKPSTKSLLVIEECGQLDSLRADKLLKAIGLARVIAVGDLNQLSAIGASGWWKDNLDRYGSTELTMVRRQKDPLDVADYQLIREGRAHHALRNMDKRGRVHVSEDSSHRVADVLMDYLEHRKGWRAQDVRIIADATNEELDTMGRFIQRDRLKRGEIGATFLEVHDIEQDRRWKLHENDQVTFLQSHFVKGQAPVKNGTEGVVLSIDNKYGVARVRIPDGDGQRVVRVKIEPHAHKQTLGLAYATHANRTQGAEFPIALVLPGMGQTSANSGYSMVTRSTHETHVYLSRELHGTDPIGALGAAWSQRDIKQSALSKLNEIRREERAQREPERIVEPEPATVSPLDDWRLNRLEQALERTQQQRETLRQRDALDQSHALEQTLGTRGFGREL